jgi:capsule polysaccharide export protein KpsE/RkpR
MISKIQDELITTRMQLRELRAYTPKNPQIEILDVRAKAVARNRRAARTRCRRSQVTFVARRRISATVAGKPVRGQKSRQRHGLAGRCS